MADRVLWSPAHSPPCSALLGKMHMLRCYPLWHILLLNQFIWLVSPPTVFVLVRFWLKKTNKQTNLNLSPSIADNKTTSQLILGLKTTVYFSL